MNEAYMKLQKRIEHELKNEYRAKLIVDTVIEYYNISQKRVFNSKIQLTPVVLVRQMIVYISCTIYGIPPKMICKNLKYVRSGILRANNIIKDQINSNRRIHTDVDNIRAELAKIING